MQPQYLITQRKTIKRKIENLQVSNLGTTMQLSMLKRDIQFKSQSYALLNNSVITEFIHWPQLAHDRSNRNTTTKSEQHYHNIVYDKLKKEHKL